jgi:hypothetical protein
MVVRCFVMLLLSVLSARAQESALVRAGETWRYIKGTQEPSSPPDAWKTPAFDDAGWSSGISGFSYGYGGEYDEPTRLSDFGAGYFSVYLRKAFAVADPAQVQWLTLRVDYNDGFVAYLNGAEVARRNLAGTPGSTVPFNAPATATHARGLTEEIDLTAFAPLLKTGTNILAIQAHGTSETDGTFTLLPELLGNFTRGPFIQNASTNKIQVIWKTPFPSDGLVQFGVTPDLGFSAATAGASIHHVVTLSDLVPDTTYYYRVRSQGGGKNVASEISTFRTLKTSGPIRFSVFGDTGSGSPQQYQIAERIRMANPDLVLHVGDVVYPLLTTNTVDARCFSVYQDHMKRAPYFFAIGNHDLYAGDFPYLDAFQLPTNSVTGTEHFYSFDHGDAHFTVLLQPYASQYLLTPGDFQHNWLTNDLASTKKPWKFLFLHVPIASSGAHRFDDYAHFGTPDCLDIRNALLPVASKYGVQMIFSGHDHDYERFNPMDGVHSIVTGGGGVALRWMSQLDTASSQFWLRHEFVNVTVDGDQLRMEAIDLDGQVFDSLSIQRALPPPKTYESTWHSPTIETGPADDEDGNITGQTFNLTGEPIPTLPGKSSNPGLVYVNNDDANLYIGFERTMIYPDGNVFLFIASPRLPGVTRMAGVGNGVVDPKAQGADGLDFLENLAFKNFTPGIGVILGDEFGDAQTRSFTRPALALDIGQGAFYLGPELRDVPGIRLQQFNRSPQSGPVPGEQNADFIELAIPLGSLGGIRAGDTIRIGAVVGLGGYDTTRQTRELDSSVLGRGLSGSGSGAVILEGLDVKLVFNPEGDEDHDGLSNSAEAAFGTDMFLADTDGDGLLDGWEAKNGLNPLSAVGPDGAAGDPDGDGLSNAREQALGTDPRDAASAVRLKLSPLGAGRFVFSWPTVAGKSYMLEFTDKLRSDFTNLSPAVFPLKAASTNQTFEAQLPRDAHVTSQELYFRVRLAE